MKFSGRVGLGTRNFQLDFGSDLHPQFFCHFLALQIRLFVNFSDLKFSLKNHPILHHSQDQRYSTSVVIFVKESYCKSAIDRSRQLQE